MIFTPDLFVAGIDFFGLSDLESYVREIPLFWQSTTEEFYLTMGNPKEPEGVKTMRAQSPLYSVSRLSHPVMILHGVHDQLVPIAQSDNFVREALRQGKSVDYLVLKSESQRGHRFRCH
jgi:dipeptidyl aminopeptidase/acylaminoacyl peptidase